jgi:hypothetical protein
LKAIATILCIYLLGLFLQPALFSLHKREHHKMSCCEKKAGHAKDCSSQDNDDCCGGMGKCNPFFSQCPICAITAVAPTGMTFVAPLHPALLYKKKFFIRDQSLVSQYQHDILRPPRFV